MEINKLSVFFPVVNEEGNIRETVEKAIRVLEELKLEYEIIVVNDGSTDNTQKVLEELAGKNKKIRIIHHPRNLGYGEALKSGFYNARFNTVVYTDGDGQFDFREVSKFLEKIKDNDLVIGFRIKRQDSFIRKFFGRGWRLTLLAFFRLTLKDVDCGFKMVRKEVLEKIPRLQSQRGAMINAELAIKTKKAGFKIGQVGVTHYPRLSGKPTGANIRVIMKSYFDLIKLWWQLKNNKAVFVLFLAIIILAAFLRFYRLSEYMTFLGDEGRDAIVIKNMLTEKHFPLIGPPTSVGNIYLGPLYYYMMALPMLIFNLNPVAAAGMDALIGVATVAFIYYIGKHWFSPSGGLAAAYLYAISSVAIVYSRSSWNPNPAPFFSLLTIFALYKAYAGRNYLWFALTGAAVAAAIQMHYLALILLPVVGFLWLLCLFKNTGNRDFWKGTFFGIMAFILLMIPLVFFDLRHNFLNYKAVVKLLSSGVAVRSDIFADILKIPHLFSFNLVERYISPGNHYFAALISLIIIFALIYKFSSLPKVILGGWLILGLLGLSLYQQRIYDHYLGFLSPVPFLLFGSLFAIKSVNKWFVLYPLFIVLVFLSLINLGENPLLYPPNNQFQRTQDVARFIIEKAEGQNFNFALLAKNNYDSAYQFYLDMYGHKPKKVPFEKTNQLFVVCEDLICDPTHSPKYELAAFGWSKILWEQNVYGVKIYKLIPNPGGKP